MVVPFPSRAPEAPGGELEPAQEVVEGELLTDEESAALDARRGLQRLVPMRVVVLVVKAKESPSGAVVWRGAVGATGVAHVVCQGFESWARRAWDASTMGTYRRQIKAAESLGDRALLAEWMEHKEHATQARHKRLTELPRLARGIVGVALGSVVGVLVLLIFAGGITWLSGAGSFLGPALAALTVAGWVLTVVAFAWTPAVASVPLWVLLAAYREGHRRGNPASWALSAKRDNDEGLVVTPVGIADALRHLGISPLNKAIKDGWTVAFSLPPVRVNNRGYQTVFSLPMGVTPDMIADKGVVLARNLHRAPLEVWPAAAEQAGFVDMFVADPGATEKPAPEYPLLHEGTCDVFEGVPLGVSQRGDVIAPPLFQNNMVFGGLMGQGKSNAVRVTMLGAALDPIAELRAYVFANNGDFDAYKPRLSEYHKGVDDSVCAAALLSLEDLYAKVSYREQRLAELGAKKVTRKLAEQHADLRPILAAFSECHELFSHEEFGKLAAEVAMKTLKRARKTAITLLFDTQSSRADAIPPKIVELVAINACFAVKTWRSNDGFLGDGSFQQGIRATELRAGKDKGTSVITGATQERFEILKWFFVEVDDDTGYDAAAEVIERAMGAVQSSVPVLGDRPAGVIEQERRDLLEDLDEVLGHERVPAADIPALLRTLAPAYGPYQRMTSGKSLADELTKLGVKVPSTGNRYPVDPAAVRAELTRCSTADLDDE